MSAEIRQLVQACLADEPSAMERLVDRFRGRVLGLCYRMLGQWQDAEDAAQETFLRVAKSLPSWDSQRDFEPWLLAIAANRCRTAISRRQRALSTELLDEGSAADLRDEGRQSSAVLLEEVEHALGIAPRHWAMAFRLFHQEGRSYAEISELLDCPIGTAKTWVHRARNHLVESLTEREVIA